MKKGVKPNCATGMVYSKNSGKCIIPENIDTDYPEHRNKAACNLTFQSNKKREVT